MKPRTNSMMMAADSGRYHPAGKSQKGGITSGKAKGGIKGGTREILSNITNNNNNKKISDGNAKLPYHRPMPLQEAKKQQLSSKNLISDKKRPPSLMIENEALPSQNNSMVTKTKAKTIKKIKRKSNMVMAEDTKKPSHPCLLAYENIDENDFGDPQCVAEYVNDIYQYFLEKEKDAVDPYYLNKQVEISYKMRAILVDWLVEVHRMFKLIPETLFLAVSMVDRFLSVSMVSKDQLQLLGVTAMFIASKCEEIYAPECMDFVYVSDGACTKQQILKMEQTLLNTLHFNITHPTQLHFLRRYSKASGSDYLLHTLCKYLIEMSLLDYYLLKCAPSLISAASVYLGRMMVGKGPFWTATLEHYTSYKEAQVRECAGLLNAFLKKSQKLNLKAIKVKYSLEKFGKVSEIPFVEIMELS